MSVRRLAMLSVHTSPLAQPGAGDGGGMNVYMRALGSALARAGVACDVFTRTEHAEQPPVVVLEPGFRVLHVPAGPLAPVPRHTLPDLVNPFADAVIQQLERCGSAPDVLHANYWVSGAVGHRLKHDLDIPLVATFHTLDRVKADAGDGDDDPVKRARGESEVARCADLMVASTPEERDQLVALYGAERDRIEIVPPGVDHRVFVPGDRAAARRLLGLEPAQRVLLFVGRIQPLKRAGLAVRALAELHDHRDLVLLIVGGPSGPQGETELARLHALVGELALTDRVRFVSARPHHDLAAYYQAADVCLVPSRTESFGLVALEAAACGLPVVAASVGGLRAIVEDGSTGFLVDGRTPHDFAAPVALLLDDPALADELGRNAAARSLRYTWSITAARLRRLYGDVAVRTPLPCS
jgi:D-inositol-3-phosphate glycosyltransferase